ncbi:LacI family DNA-binding transcriptional regulator [Paenibacillus sp. LHD-117]|uniref:LacI family DNA-binding transcriptional regulator n=1 Tax=Paenibacillus sp. LHD-117 TaxID=3071412 RepID=UPI0027DFF8A9|nr:LacI family DNA-binding transcriptional regulator [Paenibacillus sp. LHD-117]MDQ6420393.1 LacI family DNA-binding transcriptional regulator [Paenibacillus sp. LHD-117]
MGNKITSTEIARLAGVSRSTVSRVVNRYSNVPDETRRRVMDMIELHNYYPNLSGQVLAGKRTRTIGLFMADAGSVSSDSIANLLLSRIIESASVRGYFTLTHIVRDMKDHDQTRAVKECFCQRRIDGGIFIGTDNDEPVIEELIRQGYLVGIVDQARLGRAEPNRLVCNFDNVNGVRLAVRHLAELGHTSIGAIHGNLLRNSGSEKRDAFMIAMEESGLDVRPEWMLDGDFNETSGYDAMRRLLDSGTELPTALFAANDSVAFGAIRALREKGLQVPEHMSVIGFDDHLLSAKHHPPLSTVRIDFAKMMDRLTDMLIGSIEDGAEPTEPWIAEASLVVRGSCRRMSGV